MLAGRRLTPVGALAPNPATPLTILGSALVGWWNADSSGQITTTGSGVSSWKDDIANIDLVQATDAARPVWSSTSFNSRFGGVTFDKSDDYLRLASTPASFPINADTSEVWIILNQTTAAADTTTNDIFNYGSTTSANSRRVRRQVSTGVNRALIQTSSTSVNTSVDFTNRHWIRCRFVNNAQQVDVDGTTMASGAISFTTNTGNVTLGASMASTPALFWGGVVHQVMVINRSVTADEATALNAYCSARTT